jgi:hypothetical protein
MIAKKAERRASRTVGSVALGRERMEKRIGKHSCVTSWLERDDGPRVCRRRVRV